MRSKTSFVPSSLPGFDEAQVGDDLVLIDEWSYAVVLNPVGTEIWRRIDGESTVEQIAVALAESVDAQPDAVRADVVAFIDGLIERGLIANAEPVRDAETIHLLPVPEPEVGDVVDDLRLPGLDGRPHTLGEYLTHDVLLVNWSPHCGYCASIARTLADHEAALDRAGITMVVLAYGDAESNRALADDAGLTSPVLLIGEVDSPFGSSGTPSAFHLDPDRRIASEPAYGNIEVPALAARLAGVDPTDPNDGDSARVRYLLEADGFCAPGLGARDRVAWHSTVVFEIDGYRVGFRVDSPATAGVLSRLFGTDPVHDPRAGYSYSVALPGLAAGSGGGVGRGMNLLAQPVRPPVRSRDPARILRALLSDLHDRIHGPASSEGRMRALAIPVRAGDGVGLIPLAWHSFAPRLQALLAARGVALGDAPHPEVDLATAEVVIPAPAIPHDPDVIAEASVDLTGVRGELAGVFPGRYPMRGWCTAHPDDRLMVHFSRAEAAAATLSFCLDTDDRTARIRQLGELYSTVPAYGLWYYSDVQLADLISQAFGAT